MIWKKKAYCLKQMSFPKIMSIETKGYLYCQRKFTPDRIKQTRKTLFKTTVIEVRLLKHGKENKLNCTKIEGRRISKNWRELVEEYWRKLDNVIRATHVPCKSLWKLGSEPPTETGKHGCYFS